MPDPHRVAIAPAIALSISLTVGAATGCQAELETAQRVSAVADPCGTARWPISRSSAADADAIRDPYGPRLEAGAYDFHAGVDLVAAQGTPVHVVLPGTVVRATTTWSGTGPGMNVLVSHACSRFTAYLHLSAVSVTAGQVLAAGDLIGQSGMTGASTPHLHLTYMLGLTGTANDERKSHNPLEILPHSVPPDPVVSWGSLVTMPLEVQRMRVRSLTLADVSSSRTYDLYAVVALGSTVRNEQVQGGIYIEAGDPTGGTFPLRLRVDPAGAFTPSTLTIRYFDDTTFTASAPGAAVCGNQVCDAGET
jgi:murein DD-endopeptidase MepM/ murein hydrolase activator NlpD